MSEQQKPQKKHPFKLLALTLGMVALLGVGGKMYVDHAEQQRQEEVFVAEVGRMPHPKGENKGEPDLHIAARLNLPALTVSLLNQGADVHAKNNDGWTSLHWAARNDASSMAAVLLESGADVHAKNNDGWTSLYIAARNDASSVAGLLLKAGADVHAKDDYGKMPLHAAAAHNAAAVAAVLLKQGADVHAKDNDGETPLHKIFGSDMDAARVARAGGFSRTVAAFLEKRRRVTPTDAVNTPLHHLTTSEDADASAVAGMLLRSCLKTPCGPPQGSSKRSVRRAFFIG